MEQQMFIPNQDPKHLKRLNSFFCSNYRFCMKPQGKIQMPALQLHRQKHTLVLIVPAKSLSTSHPNFHRLIVKCSSGSAALYHNTSLWSKWDTVPLLDILTTNPNIISSPQSQGDILVTSHTLWAVMYCIFLHLLLQAAFGSIAV